MQPVGRVGDVEAAAVVVHGVCGWGSFGVGNSGWNGWRFAITRAREFGRVVRAENLGATFI